ncbi:MAG: ABC transporter permease [Pirellulaceae bacterium]|jgi:putative ABC transport system permease protein|nr:ABC transporter permease [Pirellulaceae bacterium]
MWLKIFQLSVRNLMLNKLRSLLTMLGTILGVSSVIAMLAIGEGSKRHAVEQIRQLGAANVIIRSVKPGQDDSAASSSNGASSQSQSSRVLEYGLRYDDFERLKATLPTVRRAVPSILLRKDAQHGKLRVTNARVLGTTPEYRFVKNLAVRRGRFLTGPDMANMSNVAVLGAGAAERLFSFEDPLEQTVLLGSGAYRVVGILDTQDSGSARPGAMGGSDFNNDIYIPLSAARSRFGELQMIVRTGSRDYERVQLSEITLTVHDETLVSQTAAMARKLLRRNHPTGDDYEIQVPLELLRQAEREKRIWNLVLGSIAGISLLVGGIGIMNIMLATVSERTREIGIRRALGATRTHIVAQFLVESTVLSASGGLLGIFLGIAIPIAVTSMSEIETAISWLAILIAFMTSVGIGMVFGVYPARRAALMDPIEALRHE